MNVALRGLRLPALVLILALGMTALVWQQQRSLTLAAQRASFDAQVRNDTVHLQQRLSAIEQLLTGIQALYASTPAVNRDAFTTLLAAQLALPALQGIRSVSLVPLVIPEQREAFVAAQRQTGLSQYEILPLGERALYTPISQIVPSNEDTAKDLGRDLFADADFQRPLTQARDTGLPTLSGPLILPTPPGVAELPGFIVAAPLYLAGQPHANVDDRRSHLFGWVVVTVATRDWIPSVLGAQAPALDVSLVDGEEDRQTSRLFQSNALTGRQAQAHPAFRSVQALQLGDHRWTLIAQSPAGQRPPLGAGWLSALVGGLLTLILAALAYALSASREKAHGASEKAQEALRESEERWRFALEGAGDGVWDWDVGAGKIHFSPRCDAILGTPQAGAAAARIHPEDEAPERAAMQACLDGKSAQYFSEHRMQGEDGQWRWIAARGMVLSRGANGAAQRMIGTITDITERKTASERLSNMAQTHALTGLANRTLFFDRLQQAISRAKRNKEELAVIHVNIDGFKAINDNFGRSVGDKLLREVGETLRASLRESDSVAHLEADHFAILLPSVANQAAAGQVAAKARLALEHDFNIDGRHINLTASLGVAMFPQHARSAETLLANATRAGLQAKRGAGNPRGATEARTDVAPPQM